MKRRDPKVSVLLVMLTAVIAAALLCVLGVHRRTALLDREAGLRAELSEVTDGENGFRSIDARKQVLWEERDALLEEERKLQTQIADYNDSSARIENQLALLERYKTREQTASAKAAVYEEAAAILAAHPEALPEVRAIVSSMESGDRTPEDALAALQAMTLAE